LPGLLSSKVVEKHNVSASLDHALNFTDIPDFHLNLYEMAQMASGLADGLS
jgi:hypothetical protein